MATPPLILRKPKLQKAGVPPGFCSTSRRVDGTFSPPYNLPGSSKAEHSSLTSTAWGGGGYAVLAFPLLCYLTGEQLAYKRTVISFRSEMYEQRG
jgi:hypothetical protein